VKSLALRLRARRTSLASTLFSSGKSLSWMRTSFWCFAAAVQHFKPATAPRALDVVGGVGDLLQFQQHKSRHDDQSIDEMGFNQVGDASINDDAGVEQEEVSGLFWGEKRT